MDKCGRCKVSQGRMYDAELGNLCDGEYDQVLETARACYELIPSPAPTTWFYLLGIGAESDELSALLDLLNEGVPYDWAVGYLLSSST